MHNDSNKARWHHALSPKKRPAKPAEAHRPPEHLPSRDDDTAVTEDLVHQMYL